KPPPSPPRRCRSTAPKQSGPRSSSSVGRAPSASRPIASTSSLRAHVRRLDPPGYDEALAPRRENEHLAFVRIESGERRDVDLVGDQHERSAGVAADQLPDLARLGRLAAPIAKE